MPRTTTSNAKGASDKSATKAAKKAPPPPPASALRLDSAEFANHLTSIRDSHEHKFHRDKYATWKRQLDAHFNLLFCGVGSKYALLDDFRREALSDAHQLIIRGYKSGRISIKQILTFIVTNFDDSDAVLSSAPSRKVMDQVIVVRKFLDAQPIDIFIIVHSLDGPALRSPDFYTGLSLLAESKRVHIMASVDHMNFALLFDQRQMRRLRFLYVSVSTFAPYAHELLNGAAPRLTTLGGVAGTSFGLAGVGGIHSLASLGSVWASLPKNSRDVFVLFSRFFFAERRRVGAKKTGAGGMPFYDLYRASRDAFLTNSEAALQTILVEYKDHHLLTSRRGTDGVELLRLDATLAPAVLREFLVREVGVEFEDDEEEGGADEELVEFGSDDEMFEGVAMYDDDAGMSDGGE